MTKYFVNEDGRLVSEVLTDSPVNPSNYAIVESSEVLGKCSNYVVDNGYVVLSPLMTSVPQSVTRFQARAALMQANLLDDVEAMMSSPETDPFITLAWKEVLEFRRDSPTILSIIHVLGLTEEQVDDLFRFASTISA